MKIYTRTGDKGTTGLYGGKRISKDNIRMEAIGTIDELNSAIGLAIAQLGARNKELKAQLTKIQGDLFEVAAVLATPSRMRAKEKRIHTEFNQHLKRRVWEFEVLIDSLTSKLLALRSFILPGGSREGASLHVVRSVSRRAERSIVAFSQKEQVDSEVLMYVNRLSDVLFTMARFVNKQKKVPETPWKGLL